LSLKLFWIISYFFVNSHAFTLAVGSLVINVHPLGKTASQIIKANWALFSMCSWCQTLASVSMYY